jgi:pimeloyl-ACP methyl ester carboxylesterase
MVDLQKLSMDDLVLPRPLYHGSANHIEAPTLEIFTKHFGDNYPTPQHIHSDLGSTAIYDLPAPSGQPKRNFLMVHGLGTPALGLWPLAKKLQLLNPDTHIVLYDLWGHGLTTTPLVAHTPQIFHSQIHQVLSFMQWPQAHLLGYSLGASTVISFTNFNPWIPLSVTVLAPAGLLTPDMWGPDMQALLTEAGANRQEEAIRAVLGFLEGGPLRLAENWRERIEKEGEILATALREWELREHKGHRLSTLSIFRDGGVAGREERFRSFARLEKIKKLAVVAEMDPVCSKSQLEELGFEGVQVVEQAGHGFARANVDDVAGIIHAFWNQQRDH